jgi:hypothetical protein
LGIRTVLAFANVTATIRTNVVKCSDGGLWVSGPLFPTDEYCALLDKLGAVKHVVLPCNALDHKAATKQFVKKYPDATVWKYRASTVCLDRVVSSQQMWMREK